MGMGGAPVVASALVDRGGGALWLASALWLVTLPELGAFRALQRRRCVVT